MQRHVPLLVAALASCAGPGATESEPDAHWSDRGAPLPRLRFERGIRSIFEDGRGDLWIGGHEEGLARFDGERFTYYSMENGLSSNQVRTIQEDSDGVVWFECGVGVSRYDGVEMTAYADRDFTSKSDWRASSCDLWFKGDEGVGVNEREGRPGTYRYDGETFTFLTFPLPGFDWTWSPEDPMGGNYYSVTTSAVRGRDGTLWFGTYGAVIGFDGESFTFIDDAHLGLDDETGHLHVRALFEDSRGDLWIGNNGVGVIRRRGETHVRLSELLGGAGEHHPSPKRVFSIGEDRDGNVWFGTATAGAWRWDGASLTNFSEEDGLTSRHVGSVYLDPRGDLWVTGDDPGGVYRYDVASFERMFR